VERKLDPTVLVRVTVKGPVFRRLAEAAARTRAGRHYLDPRQRAPIRPLSASCAPELTSQ